MGSDCKFTPVTASELIFTEEFCYKDCAFFSDTHIFDMTKAQGDVLALQELVAISSSRPFSDGLSLSDAHVLGFLFGDGVSLSDAFQIDALVDDMSSLIDDQEWVI